MHFDREVYDAQDKKESKSKRENSVSVCVGGVGVGGVCVWCVCVVCVCVCVFACVSQRSICECV